MFQKTLEFLEGEYILALYALAFLLSIYRYRKYYETLLKYFPILIFYTLLTELLGKFIGEFEEIQIVYLDQFENYNSLIYNLFEIIFFLYFYYVFWNELNNTRNKKFIKYGSIFYIIISIINPFFQDAILYPQIYALTFGSILLVITTLLYFKELDSKSTGIPHYSNLLFWISVGLMLFHVFYPIIMVIGFYYSQAYLDLHLRTLLHILICIMYLCFIVGFIFMWHNRSKEDI